MNDCFHILFSEQLSRQVLWKHQVKDGSVAEKTEDPGLFANKQGDHAVVSSALHGCVSLWLGCLCTPEYFGNKNTAYNRECLTPFDEECCRIVQFVVFTGR